MFYVTIVFSVAMGNSHEDLLNSNNGWELICILPVLNKSDGNYGKNKGEMATTRYVIMCECYHYT